MLIKCRNCEVSFDNLLSECVACGAPSVLSREERRRVCLNSINQFIKEDEEIDDVRQYLVKAELFSNTEIDKLVLGAKKMRDGKGMFKAGILILTLGLGLTGVNAAKVIMFACVLGGVILVVMGVFSIKAARTNLGWRG